MQVERGLQSLSSQHCAGLTVGVHCTSGELILTLPQFSNGAEWKHSSFPGGGWGGVAAGDRAVLSPLGLLFPPHRAFR